MPKAGPDHTAQNPALIPGTTQPDPYADLREAGINPRTPADYRAIAFAEEYFACGNMTEAAKKTGFMREDATYPGSSTKERLMANPIVIDTLAFRRRQLAERCGITAEMVVSEIAKVAFSSIDMFANWSAEDVTLKSLDEIQEDPRANYYLPSVSKLKCVSNKNGTTVTIEMHDKLNALDKLGRILDLFSEKTDGAAEAAQNAQQSKLTDKSDEILSRLAGIADRIAARAGNQGAEPGGTGVVDVNVEVLG